MISEVPKTDRTREATNTNKISHNITKLSTPHIITEKYHGVEPKPFPDNKNNSLM